MEHKSIPAAVKNKIHKIRHKLLRKPGLTDIVCDVHTAVL
jgi:hypothetical protein